MKNYSRQREAILKVLRMADTHPTASWVYQKVREEIPNISLGTVYRNLAALNEAGEILSISIGDGFEHFDGNNRPHIHLHCRCCNGITDVPLEADPFTEATLSLGFTPDVSVYVVEGVCQNCKN